MPYLVIEDFKGGLDHRRSGLTSVPGTLRVLRDCHVNRGGEIESRKRFEPAVTLPAGTFGLSDGVTLPTVFGSVAIPTTSGYGYSRITPAGGASMTGLVTACRFRTNHFVVARLSDGSTRPFYNGAPIGPGEPIFNDPLLLDCIAFKNNVYALSSGTLYRSALNNPALWKPTDTGTFAIDLAETGMAPNSARALGLYEGLVVVYGRGQIQFWSMDPDPARCTLVRTLENVGVVSTVDWSGIQTQPSVATYGDRDAFFLTDSGVRSLRVRDSSGAATFNDVGAPIDPILLADFAGNISAGPRPGVVDPIDGRYWIAFGDRIFVYSRFDGIAAWSEYLPGFSVESMAVANRRVFLRSGDVLYRYGGANNNDFTGVQPVVELPMLDLGKPATTKALTAIDAAVDGSWQVDVRCDHLAAPGAWERVAILTQPTFQMRRISTRMVGTHFGMRLTALAPGGYRRLANAIFHFESGEAG